jgi:hypothetical protein
MEELIQFISDWWDTVTIGPAPKLNTEHLVENSSGRGQKWKITYRVNRLLKNFPDQQHKFGKSGQPPLRVKKEGYRSAPYSNMFLLCKSQSEKEISELEVYYAKRYKHLENNDNKSLSPHHKMRSHDGHYFLYLVV